VPTSNSSRGQEARRQQAREEAQQRASRKAARKRRAIGIGVAVAAVVAAVGVVAAATSQKKSTTATPTTTAPVQDTTSTIAVNPGPPASLPTVSAGNQLAGATPCPAADGSSPRTTTFSAPPPMCIDPTKSYTATITTDKGYMTVDLVPGSAPKSVNNFVVLARYHYYDGLPITRIVPRGWAEVADPTFADGRTGPGYSIPSEAPAQGSVPNPLMLATLPADDGTTGGGFLFGIADQTQDLPQKATQIGIVLDARVDHTKDPQSQDTVEQVIGRAATASGAPAEVIHITKVTIAEGPATTPGTA
jgi:cyclophilin family peptidyl-prolyl cis-trans isomerase